VFKTIYTVQSSETPNQTNVDACDSVKPTLEKMTWQISKFVYKELTLMQARTTLKSIDILTFISVLADS